jgi:hypothetical protein
MRQAVTLRTRQLSVENSRQVIMVDRKIRRALLENAHGLSDPDGVGVSAQFMPCGTDTRR